MELLGSGNRITATRLDTVRDEDNAIVCVFLSSKDLLCFEQCSSQGCPARGLELVEQLGEAIPLGAGQGAPARQYLHSLRLCRHRCYCLYDHRP